MTDAVHGQVERDQTDQIVEYGARDGRDAIVVQHQGAQTLQALKEVVLNLG